MHSRITVVLREQVFLVTGGASGLGEATACALADAGARVVVADLDEEKGLAVANRLGAAVRFARCDVTSTDNLAHAVREALAMGPLRGLVCCAGIAPAARTLGRAGPHALELFERVLRVNLTGTFDAARLSAAAMAAQPPLDDGERGVIVCTASIAAFEGQTGQTAYAASKAGVAGMVLPMARDLARDGVRVVAIAPGLFETPMIAGMPEVVQQSLAALPPFPPRLGHPAEFAQLVLQVIANRMLNGCVLRLDGAVRLPPK